MTSRDGVEEGEKEGEGKREKRAVVRERYNASLTASKDDKPPSPPLKTAHSAHSR